MSTNNFCLCNHHVYTGTLLFGILCLIYGVYNIYHKHGYFSLTMFTTNHTEPILSDFIDKYPSYKNYTKIASLVENIILILVSIVLIVGNRLKKPFLHWPFIMYMFLGYIWTVIRIIFVIGVFVYSILKHPDTKFPKHDRYETFAIVLIGLVFAAIAQLYMGWVCERGRRYLMSGEEDLKMEDLEIEQQNSV